VFCENTFRRSFHHASPLIVSLLSLLFIAGATTKASSQDTQGNTETLTMSQAVTLALHQNLDLQVANIGTAVQQQNRLIARSALMPHAEFDANEAITRYNTKAQLGVQPSIIPHDVGPYQAIHMGPSFTTPVFDLTLIRRYQESGHRLLATSADEQTVREETVLLTVSEYMSHLRAEASV
jgi:outer membrane protein